MTSDSICACPGARPELSMQAGTFSVSECVYTPDCQFPEHAHDRAGFCMVIEGGFSQRHGRRTISCDQASLLFCPAEAPHADVISSRGSRCLEIDMDADVLAGVPTFSPESRNRDPRRGLANWYAYKIRSELHRPDALSPIVIEGAALALLGEFARQPTFVPRRQAPKWLERVRERLDDEFAGVPSLSALAEAAGVHRVHLARAFRAAYGCTVGEYVRQRRIGFAVGQLTQSRTSLSRIAMDAGFADQSHFTTTFRRVVGIPPGEFRDRCSASRRRR